MKRLLYILLLISTFGFSQNNSVFEQANTLYNDGKYDEAIKQYEVVLANGQHSSELYFNLGNAHYKLNHIAPSIYNYEKALLLDPADKDIKSNLAFANNMTIDAIDTLPEVGFSKMIKNITHTFGFDVWAILAIVFMVSFVLLFLSYYFSHATTQKRLTFIGSFTTLLLCFVTLAFAFHKYDLVEKCNPAIVFAQEAQVKSEPNLRSIETFKLHEGTKVQVLDTVNNWKKIQLSDGKTGWISSQNIRLLKQF
jgi:tetratricopeptide (TPR) repeat protein